ILLMSAVTGGLLAEHPTADPDRFINLVLLLTGLLLIVAAVLRLGRFIRWVPKVVISGFMNGIAVLIWFGEIQSLFGWWGKNNYAGGIVLNLAVAAMTLTLIVVLPGLLGRVDRRLNSFFPATLLAIVIATAICFLSQLEIQRVSLGASISSLQDLTTMVAHHLPTEWSLPLLMLALPFAVQLMMLAYLDTLLTSLVVDRKSQGMHNTNETTRPNKELAAQGIANASVAFFGGIPGAQATIRSVLILNEGATMRIAGIMVGVFVLIEMLLFQDWIGLIPQAVFSGVLLKVGYDVFDWKPLMFYCRRRVRDVGVGGVAQSDAISHWAMAFIVGTTLITVFVNLTAAVLFASVLFYLLRDRAQLVDLD
ncbi:MAG: SulP family inorganic anion transporter, partial [Arenicellales bacterium]|nr:SulP family inorganic anion transporter [Arenicellales bacterium]